MSKSRQADLENILISVIEEDMGRPAIKRLQERLFEKHGTSILQEIEEWEKIGEILEEQFAGGAIKITNRYIKKISESNPFQNNSKKNVIDNPELVIEIMKVVGDGDSCKLMRHFIEHISTREEALNEKIIPATSGYRKLEKMEKIGMIIQIGYVISERTGRRIPTYTTPFESLFVDIVKGNLLVNFIPKKYVRNVPVYS